MNKLLRTVHHRQHRGNHTLIVATRGSTMANLRGSISASLLDDAEKTQTVSKTTFEE